MNRLSMGRCSIGLVVSLAPGLALEAMAGPGRQVTRMAPRSPVASQSQQPTTPSALKPKTATALPNYEVSTYAPGSIRRGSTIRTQRTTIVVDVDETLCITDYNCVLWGVGSDDSSPLAGAQDAMRQLAQRFDIVYLTARPDSLREKTRRWLESRNFPKGQIVTAPSLGDFLLGQGGYKKRMLGKLRSQSPHILIGIGDKAGDAEAYRANGMIPVIVNSWSSQKYHPSDIMLGSWRNVAAFFHLNHDLLSDPVRLADAVNDRNTRLQMPSARAATN